MSALFNRSVSLTIGQPGATGTKYSGFKIAATVEFSQTPTPQTASITLTNPNPNTIGAATQAGALFQLRAGYGGVESLIFQGQAIRGGVSVKKQGTDRVLELQLRDADAIYARQLAIGITKATTSAQVLNKILVDGGLALGYAEIDQGLQFPRGFTYAGPLSGGLDRLASLVGAIWYIRDSALYMHPPDSFTGEPAPLLSYRTGLLRAEQEADSVGIDALIQPGIRPGQRVKLEGVGSLSGVYTVKEAKYTLDSRAGPFYVKARIK